MFSFIYTFILERIMIITIIIVIIVIINGLFVKTLNDLSPGRAQKVYERERTVFVSGFISSLLETFFF